MEVGATRQLNGGYLYAHHYVPRLLRVTDNCLRLVPHRRTVLPQTVKRILLIKPDHLGDVLMASSIVPVLLARYPSARIDLVCGSWARDLATRLQCFGQILIVDSLQINRGAGGPAEKLWRFLSTWWQALRRIRAEHYDICLCLRPFGGNLISLAALSGARFTAGHSTAGGGPLLDAVARWTPGLHAVEHHLEVLATCDCHAEFQTLRCLPLCGAREDDVRRVREELGIGQCYHVIIPGSGGASKMFHPNFWRTVARGLPDGNIVMCGSPEERGLFAPIAEGDPRFVNAAGRFALHELPLFYARSASVHCTDSFGAHLAALSGADTTVYYKPEADIAAWRPLGDRCRVVVIREQYAPAP